MKRIAIVEDNPDNRMLFCALLEADYDVVAYEDGMSALAHLEEVHPDLVLLDISLPGMDGCAVLAQIRRTQGLSSIPVIALTAHAMDGDREKFLEQGFDGYVSKPIVDETELFNAIQALLPTA
ncbi:MAG: response regulator [Prochlorotrichaceae cyanobacterium]